MKVYYIYKTKDNLLKQEQFAEEKVDYEDLEKRSSPDSFWRDAKKYDRSKCPASFESRPWPSRNTFRRWWSHDISARFFVFRKFLKGPKKFWARRSREFGSKTSSSRAPQKKAERDRRWRQPEIVKNKNDLKCKHGVSTFETNRDRERRLCRD